MEKINSSCHHLLHQLKSCSLRIGGNLYRRITKHIQLLKNLNDRIQTRQSWVEKAIEEKLEMDDSLQLNEDMLTDKYLHFKISLHLNEKIEKKVRIIKQFRTSFSKKQWILEAIYKKLDREEYKSKESLKNLLAEASAEYHSSSEMK